MKRIAASIVLATVFAAATLARTEKGSFLEKRVTSTSGLIAQLSDRVVLDRYTRHFGKDKAFLQKWFGSLHVEKLKKTTHYRVYNVNNAGVIGWKSLLLKAGTPVFADKSGKITLKLSCGNPMATGTDIVVQRRFTGLASATPETREFAEQPLISPSEDIAALSTPETLVAEIPAVDPTPNPSPIFLGEAGPAEVPTAATPSGNSISTPSFGTYFPLFSLLPAIGGSIGGGGSTRTDPGSTGGSSSGTSSGTTSGSSSGSTSGSTGGGSTGGSSGGGGGVNPVPEPLTLVAMASGLTALAARKRRLVRG